MFHLFLKSQLLQIFHPLFQTPGREMMEFSILDVDDPHKVDCFVSQDARELTAFFFSSKKSHWSLICPRWEENTVEQKKKCRAGKR